MYLVLVVSSLVIYTYRLHGVPRQMPHSACTLINSTIIHYFVSSAKRSKLHKSIVLFPISLVSFRARVVVFFY